MNFTNTMLNDISQKQINILNDSTYKRFKNKQNLPLVIKVKFIIIFLELTTEETRGEASRMLLIF